MAAENDTLFLRPRPGGGVYEVVGAAEPASRSIVPLGGYVTQITAGLDAAGNPEVFGIGGDGSVYVGNRPGRLVDRRFPATAISAAPTGNTVYAIGPQNTVFVDSGSGFTSLGGTALAISATSTGSLEYRLPPSPGLQRRVLSSTMAAAGAAGTTPRSLCTASAAVFARRSRTPARSTSARYLEPGLSATSAGPTRPPSTPAIGGATWRK